MLNPWPQSGRAVVGRGLTTPGSASDACRRRLRVEMTPWRTAAYGHRTFNVGFLAMNPRGRLSQSDPKRKSAEANESPESCRSTFELSGLPLALRLSEGLARRCVIVVGREREQ